jgi:predicted nuclease of predicted toxin-antitoxin system
VIKLATDESFDGDILRGLVRRQPNLDIVRIQDTQIARASDPAILEWAAAAERIVLTHDRDTLPNFAYELVRTGKPMAGVFLVSDQMAKGQAIEELLNSNFLPRAR